MFAMFGATILVPVLTGLPRLLFAGLGTLLFRREGTIAGYAAIAPNGEAELLPYACLGVACAGLLYLVLSALFRGSWALRVMKFFPPVVTGPIVISIGLILSSSAIANASTNWLVAVVAIAVIIVANIWGRGMVKIIPILLGVLVSYALAVALGEVDFSGVAAAPWIGLPVAFENTVFALSSNFDAGLAITAVITIMLLALATMIEHIGDISAISSTVNRNFIAEPGLHRTPLGDGLATISPRWERPPTPRTERTRACFCAHCWCSTRASSVSLRCSRSASFCPEFAAAIEAMPACVIGGVSLVLYGMISAVGVRNLVENKVDFMKSRNVLVAALILVLSIGIAYLHGGRHRVRRRRHHHLFSGLP